MSRASDQRNWRRRRALGVVMVGVQVEPELVDALVEERLLAEWDEGDRKAIGAAISRLLSPLGLQHRVRTGPLAADRVHGYTVARVG